MLQGLFNRFFGNLMEDDALWLFQVSDLLDMPRDRLALSIGVGREIHYVSFFCSVPYLFYHFALLSRHNVARHEATLDIDGIFVTLRQVADVTNRGEDGVVLAQVVLNGARLGRRLNNK